MHSCWSLRTERLHLRPVGPGDEVRLARLYGDPQVTAFTKLGRRSAAETATIHASYLTTWQRHDYGMCLVLDRASGRFLGECGLFGHDGSGEAALRYAFFAEHWGQGLASEAAHAVLADAFSRVGLQRVIAIAQVANPASIRIMEKLGMTQVKPAPAFKSDLVLYEALSAASRSA